MARPRKHESDSMRTAAYRATRARVDLTLDKDTGETIESIAGDLGVSMNALCVSMIKFALTNRDWRKQGLTHGKG